MKEEVKTVENIEVVGDVVSTENTSKGGFVKAALIAGGIGAVVTVVVTALKKTKETRKAKRIAKQIKALEKEGYTVLEPDAFEVDDSVKEENEDLI